MPTEKPRTIILLDDDLLQQIDDYRYRNRIPSRSKAIRELVRHGLNSKKGQKPAPPISGKRPGNK